MRELDKEAMGSRIRQIRLAAKLRQWELAQKLGTTQSAIHKYERGVVPEPRRLLELARVGGTSLEWILTGHHWENGSRRQQRLSPKLLDTANLLSDVRGNGLARIDEALRIVRASLRALEQTERAPPPDIRLLRAEIEAHGRETLRLLESARRIQRAVLHQVSRDAERRLAPPDPPDPPPGGQGSSG